MEKDLLVTVKEAAEILKVNKRHVTRMIRSGQLPAKDISLGTHARKNWRILTSDILNVQNQTE